MSCCSIAKTVMHTENINNPGRHCLKKMKFAERLDNFTTLYVNVLVNFSFSVICLNADKTHSCI